MQMWHPAQVLLIVSLISLIDFLLLLWHLMTNCTRLHPPGRDSPVLRDPAAFGWVCVQSHIQCGTQLPGSWISGLLIHEPFSAGHPIFPSDTLCSSCSLLTSFVRLLCPEWFSSWLVFIWVLCSLWTFASWWCQHLPFHPADSSATSDLLVDAWPSLLPFH